MSNRRRRIPDWLVATTTRKPARSSLAMASRLLVDDAVAVENNEIHGFSGRLFG
jgi:hypothetical protein